MTLEIDAARLGSVQADIADYYESVGGLHQILQLFGAERWRPEAPGGGQEVVASARLPAADMTAASPVVLVLSDLGLPLIQAETQQFFDPQAATTFTTTTAGLTELIRKERRRLNGNGAAVIWIASELDGRWSYGREEGVMASGVVPSRFDDVYGLEAVWRGTPVIMLNQGTEPNSVWIFDATARILELYPHVDTPERVRVNGRPLGGEVQLDVSLRLSVPPSDPRRMTRILVTD